MSYAFGACLVVLRVTVNISTENNWELNKAKITIHKCINFFSLVILGVLVKWLILFLLYVYVLNNLNILNNIMSEIKNILQLNNTE